LGLYVGQSGENDEAAELWKRALDDWRSLALLRPLSSEYQSRVGATLSNLAVLARDREEFQNCRTLAEEALMHQKQALQTKPVYKYAKEFLRTHYKQLSQVLTELGDYEALAVASDERARDLSDVPYEVSEAAISLAECALQAQSDDELSEESRGEQVERYASRALDLLEEGRACYDFDLAIWTVGDAYRQVGERLKAAELVKLACRAFEAALAIFTQLQARQPPENRRQFDEAISSVRERLANLTLREAKTVVNDDGSHSTQEGRR
jgi:hypothetical protein